MKSTAVAVIVSAACLSCAALAQVPAGWKVIAEDKGKCQMSVPADWKQGDILGKKIAMATAPNQSSDAVVNLMDDMSWDMFKGIVFQIYTKEKDKPKIEDSPKRMWFEITSMAAPGMTSWYVAVPGKAGTCNAQVNFKKGDKAAEELARKVAGSIQSK